MSHGGRPDVVSIGDAGKRLLPHVAARAGPFVAGLIISAPTSLMIAASLGKIPTTSGRRLISSAVIFS
jgi:hypothetical protein